jgi:hypothetical protein
MARDADATLIWNVAFLQPRIHTSDHHAVVVSLLREQHGQLRRHRRCRQTFPLQLPRPGGGTGRADVPFGEFAKNLRGELTGEAERKRLDLRRELAVNCPLGNALPHRQPVSNGGALPTPPNWCISSLGQGRSNCTSRMCNRVQACGGKCAGSFLPSERIVPGCVRNAGQAVLPHNGVPDFRAGQFVYKEGAARRSSPHQLRPN